MLWDWPQGGFRQHKCTVSKVSHDLFTAQTSRRKLRYLWDCWWISEQQHDKWMCWWKQERKQHESSLVTITTCTIKRPTASEIQQMCMFSLYKLDICRMNPETVYTRFLIKRDTFACLRDKMFTLSNKKTKTQLHQKRFNSVEFSFSH